MKRMSPEVYKREAQSRVGKATTDLIHRFSEWNAVKIEEEMERILRRRRFERSGIAVPKEEGN